MAEEDHYKEFEEIGPERLRLRLEHRPNQYGGEAGRAATRWLLAQDAKAAAMERKRFQTLRRWAIIAGVAAVLAAIAAWIAAWPVIRG